MLIVETLGGGKGLFQHLVGQRHRRRGEGGDTVFGQIPRHTEETLIVAIGEVGIGVAVVMDIHQTGDHILAAQIHAVGIGDSGQNVAEAAVFHIEAAVDESVTAEDVSILKKHCFHLC